MPSDTDAIIVRIIASQAEYEKQMAAVARSAEKTATYAERQFNKSNDNIAKGFNKAGSQAAQGLKSAQQAASGLSFQLNDIATSLSGGASPFQVMMQQGSQVSQVFQQLKAQGGSVGQALAGAFGSMLNPISLVSFGLIGLAGYALQYFTSVEDGAGTSNDAIKKQRDLLEQVARKWGDMLPILRDVLAAQQDVADAADVSAATSNFTAGQYAPAKKAIQDLIPEIVDARVQLQQLDPDSPLLPKSTANVNALSEALENNTASSREVLAVEADLAEQQDKYGTSTEELRNKLKTLAPQLDQIAARANAARQQAQAATRANQEYAAFVQNMAGIVGGQKNIFEQLKEALDKYIASLSNLDEKQQAVFSNRAMVAYGAAVVQAVNTTLDNAQGSIDAFVEHTIKAESGGDPNARNPNSSATGAGQFLSSTWLDVMRRHFGDQLAGMNRDEILALRNDLEWSRKAIRAYAQDNALILEQAGQTASEANLQLAHFLGPQGAVSVLKAAPRTRISDIPGMGAAVAANPTILGGGATREDVLAYAARRAGSNADALKDENKALDEWIAKKKEEIDLSNKANDINKDSSRSINERNAEIEEAKLYQEGLNAALKQYGTVSDELKVKIRETAHEAAMAGLRADNLKTAQQDAAKATADHRKELQQLAQQTAQMAGQALSGFITDLRNGVSAGDAFKNMINRIIDSLIQMSIQMLVVKPLTNMLSAGFGVPAGVGHSGGTVGHIGGDGRSFSPLLWQAAPRYHTGGVVGLRPGELPIIAKKGEIIVPNSSRIGAGGTTHNSSVVNNNGDIAIDMNSGYVAADTDSGKKFGYNVSKLIQMELVKESRPGGLLRKV